MMAVSRGKRTAINTPSQYPFDERNRRLLRQITRADHFAQLHCIFGTGHHADITVQTDGCLELESKSLLRGGKVERPGGAETGAEPTAGAAWGVYLHACKGNAASRHGLLGCRYERGEEFKQPLPQLPGAPCRLCWPDIVCW